MNSATTKYRSSAMHRNVIAFSISYQPENLLARGLGLEHIRELLIRLARPILRQGASLAYGGHWEVKNDNFTYDLLRLISAEQEDNSHGGMDTSLQIGVLYNHSPWPRYLAISRRIEAQWINACRIVRVTQQQAGFSQAEIASDADLQNRTPRAIFNEAVTLSAMRRLTATTMFIDIPGAHAPEEIPPVKARILLGGKLSDFSGFLPGLFEEALVTFESNGPLYILGGFGGAAETLANAILAEKNKCPEELTIEWLASRTPNLAKLLEISRGFAMPPNFRTAGDSLAALVAFLKRARANPSGVLNTGLDNEETRELLTTRNVAVAVKLVRQGLVKMEKLPRLSA
jgi:hypothetical protein